MNIALIDYGSGNLHSVQKAFEWAGRSLDHPPTLHITRDPDIVARADALILPGVGAFADCATALYDCSGLIEAMEEAVLHNARPFLGICVGMQLLADRGVEYAQDEGTKGLGWIHGEVVALAPSDPALKIPHMGWNQLTATQPHPMLETWLKQPDLHTYFVHSFHLKPADSSHLLSETDYGGSIAAIVGRDTIIGTQFHPEKSQTVGLDFITHFLRWRP